VIRELGRVVLDETTKGTQAMEFTRYELYMLINQDKPLWLARADLSEAILNEANLRVAKLLEANLEGANL
jgi:uncharacterized protein YjbI with pentapeptide repeats